MSIHESVTAWLRETVMSNVAAIYFNFGQAEIDTATIVPTDTIKARYIDGTALHRYNVQLICFLPASFEDDGINAGVYAEIDAIKDALMQAEEHGNYPIFDGGTVQEIEVLSTEAGYSIAQDGTTAKYIVPFAIDYLTN